MLEPQETFGAGKGYDSYAVATKLYHLGMVKPQSKARNNGTAGTCPHKTHSQSLLFWAVTSIASHFLALSSNS